MKKTIQTILLGFQLISFSCSVSDPLDSESVSINTDQAITLKTVQVSNLKDQGIYQVSGIIKQSKYQRRKQISRCRLFTE